jgi:DNA-binding LacI/PurR family transcriptional regulator
MGRKSTVYDDIKTLLKDQIEAGALAVGDRLPSEYQLVRDLKVNRSRARQALRELEIEGYIVRRRGSGSYVAAPPGQVTAVRATNKTTVALVFPRYLSRYARQVVEGFMKHMAVAEKQTVAYNVQPDPESEAVYLRSIAESGVAGLTVWLNNDTPAVRHFLLDMKDRGFPIVLTDRYFDGLELDHVVSANEEIGYLLTRALLERGHRRVAFAGYRESASSILDRYKGYRRALREAGMELPPTPEKSAQTPLTIPDEALRRDARNAVKEIMALRDRPTAFVCIHDYEAEIVAVGLGHLGYCVPDDVELGAVDDEHGQEAHPLPGIWIAQDAFEVGTQTAEVLCQRVADPWAPVQRRAIPPAPAVLKEKDGTEREVSQAPATPEKIRNRR